MKRVFRPAKLKECNECQMLIFSKARRLKCRACRKDPRRKIADYLENLRRPL